MRDYYSYRLMRRENEFNIFLRGKKLSQQYVTDMYAKIHQYELNFLRNNQDTLRADLYCCLHVALQHDDVKNTGRKVVTPASHPGSPRWMNQRFHDAMAIVRKYGKPDYFITFTCNPQWPEIQESLFPGQSAHDRQTVISRVFRMKLKELKHDLYKNNYLGKPIAHMSTIEFQKRGLPHCHLLIILQAKDKLRNNEGIMMELSLQNYLILKRTSNYLN